jgi:hypothetical protein
MKQIQLIYTFCIALLAALVVMPISGQADSSIRAKFTWDGIATCENPPVQNLPIHVEGTGTLNVDRRASLDVSGSAMGVLTRSEHYDTTLGGKPTAAEDGAASVRVLGRSHLQAVRSYPNNSVIADLYVSGKSCTLRIDHRLNRGQRQYTLPNPMGGLAYCDRPRTVRTSCEPI